MGEFLSSIFYTGGIVVARLVIGVTGASGVILAYRLASFLLSKGHEVELVMTASGQYTALFELGKELASAQKWQQALPSLRLHPNLDVGAAICSGSYKTDGMVILPCSMSTLAALSVGMADNCLRMAADVTFQPQ